MENYIPSWYRKYTEEEMREWLSDKTTLTEDDFEYKVDSVEFARGIKSELKKPDNRAILLSFDVNGSKALYYGKKNKVIIGFSFLMIDDTEYYCNMWLGQYSRSISVARKKGTRVGTVNGKLAGNHYGKYYHIYEDGSVASTHNYSVRIKPNLSNMTMIDESNAEEVKSTFLFNDGPVEIYPPYNNSSSGSTDVCRNDIYSTSWITYFKTDVGEQYFAMYCPSENPDIKQFSKIIANNDDSLESLAFNVLGTTCIGVKQYFQDML